MSISQARVFAILLAFVVGQSIATSSSTPWPPIEGGTGRYTLPVEPPFISDDTSIIRITIITPTLPTTLVTDSLPESTSTPEPASSNVSSYGLPTGSSLVVTDTVTMTPPTTTASSPASNDELPNSPTSSSPNSAAAATVFFNVAGIVLVAAVGLGMAV